MKQIAVVLLAFSMVGCSWTSQAIERMSSNRDPDSIAIQCMALGEARTVFETRIVRDEEGNIREVADITKPVLHFPCKAEAPKRTKDGEPRDSLNFDVQCPIDDIQFCRDVVIDGLWVKVGGYQEIPEGVRVLRATYVQKK